MLSKIYRTLTLAFLAVALMTSGAHAGVLARWDFEGTLQNQANPGTDDLSTVGFGGDPVTSGGLGIVEDNAGSAPYYGDQFYTTDSNAGDSTDEPGVVGLAGSDAMTIDIEGITFASSISAVMPIMGMIDEFGSTGTTDPDNVFEVELRPGVGSTVFLTLRLFRISDGTRLSHNLNVTSVFATNTALDFRIMYQGYNDRVGFQARESGGSFAAPVWVSTEVYELTSGSETTQPLVIGKSRARSSIASTFTVDAITISIPEPASMGLLACGGLLLLSRQTRH